PILYTIFSYLIIYIFRPCLSPFSTSLSLLFFFNDTATTEIYTLSLHDALPIFGAAADRRRQRAPACVVGVPGQGDRRGAPQFLRSEEHTSELQSRGHLVCRLLLEKKKKQIKENQ